jgi:tripartite-type tricarboxylate transporter receptor subunit TctC
MNNAKRLMLTEMDYSYAYGATSRAIAFRDAARLAEFENVPTLVRDLKNKMRIWARAAAQDIKRYNNKRK